PEIGAIADPPEDDQHTKHLALAEEHRGARTDAKPAPASGRPGRRPRDHRPGTGGYRPAERTLAGRHLVRRDVPCGHPGPGPTPRPAGLPVCRAEKRISLVTGRHGCLTDV